MTCYRLAPRRARFLLGAFCLTTAFQASAAPDKDTPDTSSDKTTTQLTAVSVVGQSGGFRNPSPPGIDKSSLTIEQTPRTVTVVTRELLDVQQAQTLADALHNVPGVVSNNFGRRGWDDLIIRGQTASDSLFVDGLRTAASNRVAEQLFGYEQVEVLKGPASLMYGLVLPGGVVNMVSKRPQPDAFGSVDVTAGSDGLRQASFDVGAPLSANGRSAVRVNGLAMNSDDATQHVWFRNRWIAPSLSLDLGEDTDFVLLTSLQERHYVRQQGLPLVGSIKADKYGAIPRDTFMGEPGQEPYDGRQTRVGYALTHRFSDGWTLTNNLRVQDFTLDGQLVANGAMNADQRTVKRTGTDQHYSGRTLVVDSRLMRSFETAHVSHEVTLGVDYMDSREDAVSRTCTVAALDAYLPVYGAAIVCPAKPRTDTRTDVNMVGVYARDQLTVGEAWHVTAGLRRDRTWTATDNHLTGTHENDPASANTGSLAVMYDLASSVHPYLSYATSFYPNTGTNVQARPFAPEKGKQWELGLKFDLMQGRMLVTTALYDLRRQNVLQDDPVNEGYSIAIGEQRTRGAELGVTADLGGGLSLNGGYAYTQGLITDDGGEVPSTDGQRINNVPRHSATLFARYQSPGSPWSFNGGFRGESSRFAYSYTLPGYVVADAGIAWDAQRWHLALSLKNVFDKHYYAGGLAAAVALGDDRSTMFNVGYRF